MSSFYIYIFQRKYKGSKTYYNTIKHFRVMGEYHYLISVITQLTQKLSPDKKTKQGFPGGAVVTFQRRGHGFEPWSGKIPHAAEQLSLCATTTEPTCHNY